MSVSKDGNCSSDAYTTFTHIHAHIFLRSQKNEALQQDPWEQVSRVGRIPNDAEVVSNLEGRPS